MEINRKSMAALGVAAAITGVPVLTALGAAVLVAKVVDYSMTKIMDKDREMPQRKAAVQNGSSGILSEVWLSHKSLPEKGQLAGVGRLFAEKSKNFEQSTTPQQPISLKRPLEKSGLLEESQKLPTIQRPGQRAGVGPPKVSEKTIQQQAKELELLDLALGGKVQPSEAVSEADIIMLEARGIGFDSDQVQDLIKKLQGEVAKLAGAAPQKNSRWEGMQSNQVMGGRTVEASSHLAKVEGMQVKQPMLGERSFKVPVSTISDPLIYLTPEQQAKELERLDKLLGGKAQLSVGEKVILRERGVGFAFEEVDELIEKLKLQAKEAK